MVVGAEELVVRDLAAAAAVSSWAFSASGSYPSFSILSASAFAAFSAASKSISSPATFFAPSFVVFFAPRMLVRLAALPVAPFRRAADVVVRMAVGAGSGSCDSDVASGEGDFGRAAPLAVPAVRKGEAVRETTGGEAVREGGLLGLFMVGLSQDEKKSSAGSLAGVEAPSAGLVKGSSVITTSSG